VATAVVLACLPATARAMTGNDLWSYCAAPDNYAAKNLATGVCDAHVTAIADSMLAPGGVWGRRACFPEHSNMGQSFDIVKRYLDQHPEQRHLSASALVAKAIGDAFPCKP
jgi:hypothetical protein